VGARDLEGKSKRELESERERECWEREGGWGYLWPETYAMDEDKAQVQAEHSALESVL
jgi:hypothetical protein